MGATQADLPTRRPLQDGQRHLPPPRRGRKPLGPPGSRPPSPAVRRGCCCPAPDRQLPPYPALLYGAVVATATDVRPRRAGGSWNDRELRILTARSAGLQPTGPVGTCARMTHHAQNSFLWRVSLRTIAIGRPVPALGSSGRRRGVDLGHGLRRAATPGAVQWSLSPRTRAPHQAHIAAERARAQDSTDEGQQEGRPAPTWDHPADHSMAHRQRGLPVPSGRTPDRHEGSPCACVARLRTKRCAGLRCFFQAGVGVGRSVRPTMLRCACHFARALTTPPQDTTQRGGRAAARVRAPGGRTTSGPKVGRSEIKAAAGSKVETSYVYSLGKWRIACHHKDHARVGGFVGIWCYEGQRQSHRTTTVAGNADRGGKLWWGCRTHMARRL